MIDDPNEYRRIIELANQLQNVEIRILLKILSAFFSKIHRAQVQYESSEWIIFKQELIDAYRYQMLTCHGDAMSEPSQNLLSSEKKSILPLLIMSQLTKVCESNWIESPDYDYNIENKAANIFWELDDLIDLTKDIKNGQVNSIVIRIEMAQPQFRLKPQNELLIYLLESNTIPMAIEGFCTHLCDLILLLKKMPRSTSEIPFSELILSYICNWIPINFIAS
jgi:hypothetical protein